MDKLVSIRTNILYFKKKKESINEADTMLRHHELIFVVEKAKYSIKDTSGLIQTPDYSEFKFIVSEENFAEMIDMLKKLYVIDESTIGISKEEVVKTEN